MFKGLLAFFGRAREVKNTLVKFAELADRADDDLDGDGKSELQNIKDELQDWALTAFHFGQAHLLQLERVAARAKRLVEHVQTGK
jgi:hypothetical protein